MFRNKNPKIQVNVQNLIRLTFLKRRRFMKVHPSLSGLKLRCAVDSSFLYFLAGFIRAVLFPVPVSPRCLAREHNLFLSAFQTDNKKKIQSRCCLDVITFSGLSQRLGLTGTIYFLKGIYLCQCIKLNEERSSLYQ